MFQRSENANLKVHMQPDAYTHVSRAEDPHACRERGSCWVWGRGSGFKRK